MLFKKEPRKFEFQLGDDMGGRFREWNKAHLDERHGGKEPYSGAIGGRVSFRLTSTSLGMIVSAECSCGASECLTDFSDW